MSGIIIPIILKKGWGFPGTGPPPAFWPFVVSLRTVMALLNVSFSLLICNKVVYSLVEVDSSAI